MQIELEKGRNGFEAKTILEYRAIHRNVLLIAATRLDGTWKAYVHTVFGKSHKEDALEAYEKGDGVQMQESHARAFFGKPFENMKYAR